MSIRTQSRIANNLSVPAWTPLRPTLAHYQNWTLINFLIIAVFILAPASHHMIAIAPWQEVHTRVIPFAPSVKPNCLCLRCGNSGHHANVCHSKSSRADRPIRVTWKIDKLISKSGRALCILFNIKGSCRETSPTHHEHSCSLCGDTHHGAARCTRN